MGWEEIYHFICLRRWGTLGGEWGEWSSLARRFFAIGFGGREQNLACKELPENKFYWRNGRLKVVVWTLNFRAAFCFTFSRKGKEPVRTEEEMDEFSVKMCCLWAWLCLWRSRHQIFLLPGPLRRKGAFYVLCLSTERDVAKSLWARKWRHPLVVPWIILVNEERISFPVSFSSLFRAWRKKNEDQKWERGWDTVFSIFIEFLNTFSSLSILAKQPWTKVGRGGNRKERRLPSKKMTTSSERADEMREREKERDMCQKICNSLQYISTSFPLRFARSNPWEDPKTPRTKLSCDSFFLPLSSRSFRAKYN